MPVSGEDFLKHKNSQPIVFDVCVEKFFENLSRPPLTLFYRVDVFFLSSLTCR